MDGYRPVDDNGPCQVRDETRRAEVTQVPAMCSRQGVEGSVTSGRPSNVSFDTGETKRERGSHLRARSILLNGVNRINRIKFPRVNKRY